MDMACISIASITTKDLKEPPTLIVQVFRCIISTIVSISIISIIISISIIGRIISSISISIVLLVLVVLVLLVFVLYY